jgi:oligopeptide/dipeptide ABC transporter ATP-binding protein
MSKTLIEVKDLTKHFPVQRGILYDLYTKDKKVVHAVDGLNFTIEKGETFSLVGETGSGKTTVGKLTIRLLEPTSGKVFFENRNIFDLSNKELRQNRRDMQIIFQDPFSSLNPRQKAGDLIGAPFVVHGIAHGQEKTEKVLELLELVGLTPASEAIRKYPHEFSGGQKQRIGIARAIALRPKFIVCDEPVTSLDVSIRAQILNLLRNLKKSLGLTYLYISHDLTTVNYLSDRVAVMYLGKIVELAETDELFSDPLHPYTQALISAIPVSDPNRKLKPKNLEGEIPSPIDPPLGCRFHTRCPNATSICSQKIPELIDVGNNHKVACLEVS